MTTRTQLKAGKLATNHNEALQVRTALKAGGSTIAQRIAPPIVASRSLRPAASDGEPQRKSALAGAVVVAQGRTG